MSSLGAERQRIIQILNSPGPIADRVYDLLRRAYAQGREDERRYLMGDLQQRETNPYEAVR